MCPDALLEAVAACDAQLAWLSSVRAAVLGSYAALDWSVLGDQWCREQVSVACGIDGGEAFRRISTSLALAERLPATRTALAAGHRGWDFAVAVAQATAGLDPACCRQIELELLGDPALRTPGRSGAPPAPWRWRPTRSGPPSRGGLPGPSAAFR